ncbi:DMT family transporter [Sneathiella sp.]|uniref:DMT family transporter n=1 Tax=Sneathiella sp. TaxID=1964365 RepID=UPI003568B464
MSLKNWGYVVVLSIIWGGSFFLVEVALVDLTPFTIVFLRVSVAALTLIAVIYLSGRRLPRGRKLWRTYMVMGLLNNVLPFSLIVWGQTQITGSEASILNAMTPIFTVLVAHFFTLDERLTLNKGIGVLLGFAGVFVMMQPSMNDGFSPQGFGQLSILCAALFYGFAGVWGKQLREIPPLSNAAGMLICSSFIMLPILFIVEDPFALPFHWISFGAVVGIAVISTAFAFMLYFSVLASAGATNLLLVTFMVPVSALILGIGILGEEVEPMAFLGMGIIFAGLVVIDGRIIRLGRARA